MRLKFDEQLRQLNIEMTNMGTMIQEAIQQAINAFLTQNVELAKKIMEEDEQIDHEQKQIESICLNLLIQQETGLSIMNIEEPELTVVKGLGMIMETPDYERLAHSEQGYDFH